MNENTNTYGPADGFTPVKPFYQRLLDVQTQLKAPKGRTNKFGGYKYRSCEDILKAVKPLLKEAGLLLTLSDKIVEIEGRYYVEATAAVKDAMGSDLWYNVTAYAREAEEKKGMDDSQVTGTASSYARKYALNGLFCLDDVVDADGELDDLDGDGPRCRRCGQLIKGHRAAMPGGANYKASAIAKMTKQKYGRELCWDCAAKEKGEKAK